VELNVNITVKYTTERIVIIRKEKRNCIHVFIFGSSVALSIEIIDYSSDN